MKRFKLLLAGMVFAVLSVTAVLTPAGVVNAINPLEETCQTSGSAQNPICQNSKDNANSLIQIIINVLLFIIGVLAVIMLIWGGIMYTTSAGDAGRVKKAKDTILYSIVGLVLAFVAFAIVSWVFSILPKT